MSEERELTDKQREGLFPFVEDANEFLTRSGLRTVEEAKRIVDEFQEGAYEVLGLKPPTEVIDELTRKYYEAEKSSIWDRSGSINNDMRELYKEVSEYRTDAGLPAIEWDEDFPLDPAEEKDEE